MYPEKRAELTFKAGISAEAGSWSVFKPTPYLTDKNDAIAKPMENICD